MSVGARSFSFPSSLLLLPPFFYRFTDSYCSLRFMRGTEKREQLTASKATVSFNKTSVFFITFLAADPIKRDSEPWFHFTRTSKVKNGSIVLSESCISGSKEFRELTVSAQKYYLVLGLAYNTYYVRSEPMKSRLADMNLAK